MNGKIKMLTGITLVIAVLSVTFLTTPTLANANGTQIEEQDRLRTREQDGHCDMIQTKNQQRLRTQSQYCECEGEGTQQRTRTWERNEINNCEMNVEQHMYQHRKGT